MFPTPNVSRRDKARRSCRTQDHQASAETPREQDLEPCRPQVQTTNGTLLLTEPSYDLARYRRAPRKSQPFRVASVHSLLVWPSPRGHGRNPRFPNSPRATRQAGETANNCSIRSHAMRPASLAIQHDDVVCTPLNDLASLAAQNTRAS